MTFRRNIHRQAWEAAVSRESERIVEDIIIPELMTAVEESHHEYALQAQVPYISICQVPRDLPSSYRQYMFETAVQQASASMLKDRGLSSFELTLERKRENHTASGCILPAFFCFAPSMPVAPQFERLLSFTCTVPPSSKAVTSLNVANAVSRRGSSTTPPVPSVPSILVGREW
ncbi:hypothetical protein DIPPA_17777 [Diplonema papillatum]|nr:hypothetical protein DIPPA_17777 [Diplonema papillatum]